jgi:hypothetical protein
LGDKELGDGSGSDFSLKGIKKKCIKRQGTTGYRLLEGADRGPGLKGLPGFWERRKNVRRNWRSSAATKGPQRWRKGGKVAHSLAGAWGWCLSRFFWGGGFLPRVGLVWYRSLSFSAAFSQDAPGAKMDSSRAPSHARLLGRKAQLSGKLLQDFQTRRLGEKSLNRFGKRVCVRNRAAGPIPRASGTLAAIPLLFARGYAARSRLDQADLFTFLG